MEPGFPGIPKATKVIAFPGSPTVTTILGPVPKGRVYRVFDVDFRNASAGIEVLILSLVKDNGSGDSISFQGTLGVATLISVRSPQLAVGFGTLGQFIIPDFVLEFDDVLRATTTTGISGSSPTAKCSYWDLPA